MEVPDRPAELVARHVDGVVEECIADFRVTIVNGPRQVGKTTLLRQLPPAGRAVGIEVKAATTVRAEDFRHLALLRDRIGADFVAGIVFFTGDRPLPFGDRLLALPISSLWNAS